MTSWRTREMLMSRSADKPDPSKGPQTYEPKVSPSVVAMQWTGKNWPEVSQWVYGTFIDVDALADTNPELWDSLPVTTDVDSLSIVNSYGNPYIEKYGWLLFRDGEWIGMDEDEFESIYEV